MFSTRARCPFLVLPSRFFNSFCYDDDDDDDEEYTIAITPVLPTEEPDNSLSMGDEHLSTIPETESDELIKSSVENLVPIPSESEDLSDIKSGCDVPVCDDFTTFSNPLFDADDDFSSSDDKSFSDEDVPKEIYSNPLFDEEIKDLILKNAEAMIESFLSISSTVVDSNDSPSLHENESFHFDVPSSPRPPAKPPNDDEIEPDAGVLTAKVVGDISDLYVHVPNVLTTLPTLYPMFDTLLPFSSENEDKVFNHGILAYNEEKSPHLLSHRGFNPSKIISDFSKSPMMISGGDIPILDVLFLHFYPP
ncbi:hypothetical protein Tco_0664814 [Tanacetum coccineum]